MKSFAVKNHLSVWLILVALILSACMMRPTGASLVALFFEGMVLFAARQVAQVEARAALVSSSTK